MDIVDVILVARQRGRLDLLHHLQAAPGCAEWSSHRIGALGSALVLTVGDFCWNGAQVTGGSRLSPRLTSQICSCPSCASNARRSFVGEYELQGTHGYAPQCSAVLNSTHVGYHKYSLGTLVCKGTGLKACQLLKAAAADELSDSAADSSPSCARISTGVAREALLRSSFGLPTQPSMLASECASDACAAAGPRKRGLRAGEDV
jgi:hypothetical protein